MTATFNRNEINLLETLILPYGLLNSNTTLATREISRTKSLIDYVTCESLLSSQTLDSVLKSDHLATLTLVGETVKNKTEAIKKSYQKQLDVFQNLKSSRERWNFINEIRYSEKTQTEIPRLTNIFGTVLTNENDIANLRNYKFSALGENFGRKEQYQFCSNVARHSNKFISRYTTTKEIFDMRNNLYVKKPLGTSLIPAWVLKDAREHIAELLCFLFNQFLTEQLFS